LRRQADAVIVAWRPLRHGALLRSFLGAYALLRPWMSSKRVEEKRSYGPREIGTITSSPATMLHPRRVSAGLEFAAARCGLATAFAACSARYVLAPSWQLAWTHCARSWRWWSLRLTMSRGQTQTSRDPGSDSTRDLSSHLRAPAARAKVCPCGLKSEFPVSAYAAQSRSMVRD
jgi:hypothetical protein